ncbi:MAG: sugar transferase [Actinobacteria bacterium]|nr:sugar transferase [Actinomycetota bacterium]
MDYRPVSVLTLVRGRQEHLTHLIAGLRSQSRRPDELVIAYMQDDPPQVPDGCPFIIRCIHVEGEPMPLAAARNRAATAAHGDLLAFLDVDCIPDEHFVKRAIEAIHEVPHGVFLPEVRYLPGARRGWLESDGRTTDYASLQWAGRRHPAKRDLTNVSIEPIGDFGELWGLAFILAKSTWTAAGGMDEEYVGYGAEETDFGRRLEGCGAELFWLGGTICYHQHHVVHKPPLQHFESIVRNARLFRRRWGEWCMDYWLDDFERRGLVDRSGGELRVLRPPTPAEINATEQGPHVRFS